MNRRRFVFWVGFGMFSLSDKLGIRGLDRLAAATMDAVAVADGEASLDMPDASSSEVAALPVHWAAAGDDKWRWYERETLVDGEWVPTGITTPINKLTGEPKYEPGGYLAVALLPVEIRTAERSYAVQQASFASPAVESSRDREDSAAHQPTASIRSRHGRPPSKWLRSLYAFELSIWLKTIEVPEADVSGMTFWEHLTRDHLFDAKRILGLTEAEQAKLHAAAHFGY